MKGPSRQSTATARARTSALPKPRHHDIIALIREGKMQMEGNIEMAMANFLTLKLMLEKPRKLGGAS